MKIDKSRETRKKSITVGFLFETTNERFRLRALNGENGFDNQIKDKNLNRPGLALAGYLSLFTHDRVQLIGNTEVHYLQSLTPEQRMQAFNRIIAYKMPCIILTNGKIITVDDRFTIATARQAAQGAVGHVMRDRRIGPRAPPRRNTSRSSTGRNACNICAAPGRTGNLNCGRACFTRSRPILISANLNLSFKPGS